MQSRSFQNTFPKALKLSSEYSGGQSQIDAVEVVAKGEQFETRYYRELFPLNPILAGGNANFDVTPDGRGFVIPVQPEVTAATHKLDAELNREAGVSESVVWADAALLLSP